MKDTHLAQVFLTEDRLPWAAPSPEAIRMGIDHSGEETEAEKKTDAFILTNDELKGT